MKKKINLLITCVGGGLMPELLIHLKKSPKYDFKIIGTDKNYQTNSKHFCDKFYQTPDGSDEKKFIDKIKNIISPKIKIKKKYFSKSRSGDHAWYITDYSKFKKKYPNWIQKYSIKKILNELINLYNYN